MQSFSSSASHRSHHESEYATRDLNAAAFFSYRGVSPARIEAALPDDPQRHAAFVFPRTPALAEALLEFSSDATTFVEVRRYNACRGDLLRQAISANRSGGAR